MLDTEPLPCISLLGDLYIRFHPFQITLVFELLILLLLLSISALVSASEVAYFSLSPSDLEEMRGKPTLQHKTILRLHGMPERLLASVLIMNNLVNVGIVILAAFITNSWIDFSQAAPWISFIFQVVFITFLILLFGEIMPKIYANAHARRFASFIALPLSAMVKLLHPLSSLLIKSTAAVNRKFMQSKMNISMDDISDALDLPSTWIKEDEKILKGIATFGNIEVSEIMQARMDVVSAKNDIGLKKLLSIVVKSGYSRIPVYEESFDNVKGILYTKDLLPHLNERDDFRWQELIRPPYFVPETKKISDLLKEFQMKKIHMAVVIDEYGGTQGIVTLEDILEEIVGEISDEYDEDELSYIRVDNNTCIFEGKTLLTDFCKTVNIPLSQLDDVRGEADTLAGLILEMQGTIPVKNEIIHYRNLTFRIESVDERRIKKIRVTVS